MPVILNELTTYGEFINIPSIYDYISNDNNNAFYI